MTTDDFPTLPPDACFYTPGGRCKLSCRPWRCEMARLRDGAYAAMQPGFKPLPMGCLHPGSLPELRAALTDPDRLHGAFVFSDAPQGYRYWWAEAKGPKLSDTARAIIEATIAELEARRLADATNPTGDHAHERS